MTEETPWKPIEYEAGKSWIDCSRQVELRVRRMGHNAYSIALLRCGIYGPGKYEESPDIHTEVIRGSRDRLSERVKTIMAHIDSYLEEGEKTL